MSGRRISAHEPKDQILRLPFEPVENEVREDRLLPAVACPSPPSSSDSSLLLVPDSSSDVEALRYDLDPEAVRRSGSKGCNCTEPTESSWRQ